jgi:hypothetical protein
MIEGGVGFAGDMGGSRPASCGASFEIKDVIPFSTLAVLTCSSAVADQALE